MSETSNFSIFQNTAPVLRFTLLIPDSVAGWTTKFFVREKSGNVTFQQDGNTANASIGVFDVALTANTTANIGAKTYSFTFERTNEGFEDVLADGVVIVKTKQ
jgi:hypothetical protein